MENRPEHQRRKLAAILVADVVGFSRMMGTDESGTLAQLKTHRKEVVDPSIEAFHGRIVKTTGDGALVEFDSVVDAVSCAVATQQAMARRNAGLAEDRRITFRLGINLGDIIVDDDDDIYGDGVNVAARLQTLADPGGICVSGVVYDQIKNKLPFPCEFVGEQAVKNIAEPVRVYRVGLEPAEAGVAPAPPPSKARKRSGRRLAAVAAAVAALAVIAGAALWLQPWQDLAATGGAEQAALALPDKPSIAVLPLNNMSGDPSQDYFSDGISESIITELARFPELFVIARNSTFAYKGKAVNIPEVGRELGVRFVLEGSVQKSAGRVRITVQLIDAVGGQHIWAERFDRKLDDLFAVQDEITRRIVGTLAVKVSDYDLRRAVAKSGANLDAYDCVLRGRAALTRTTRSANREARSMFEKAIELSPDYAAAHVGLGRTYLNAALFGWTEFVGEALEKAQALGVKAAELEDAFAEAHALLGEIYLFRRQYDLAMSELRRAVELNPNDASSYAAQGTVLLWSSRPAEAIHALETALRFDPNMSPTGVISLGLAYFLEDRDEDVVRLMERSIRRNPDFLPSHVILAAAYGEAGRGEAAARELQAVRRLDPFFSVDAFGRLLPNPKHRAKIVEGLAKAGLE